MIGFKVHWRSGGMKRFAGTNSTVYDGMYHIYIREKENMVFSIPWM